MPEIKPERIWVIEEEDGLGITPTRPKYEGAYTEYVRADLQPQGEPVGEVVTSGDSDPYVVWKDLHSPPVGTKLYLQPQAPEPAQGERDHRAMEVLRKERYSLRWESIGMGRKPIWYYRQGHATDPADAILGNGGEG